MGSQHVPCTQYKPMRTKLQTDIARIRNISTRRITTSRSPPPHLPLPLCVVSHIQSDRLALVPGHQQCTAGKGPSVPARAEAQQQHLPWQDQRPPPTHHRRHGTSSIVRRRKVRSPCGGQLGHARGASRSMQAGGCDGRGRLLPHQRTG